MEPPPKVAVNLTSPRHTGRAAEMLPMPWPSGFCRIQPVVLPLNVAVGVTPVEKSLGLLPGVSLKAS